MKRKKQKVTVGFISLGCPKNSVDSERMLAEIAEAGFLITADPDTADVVVINTCGFIAPAKAESLEAIRHTLEHKLSGAVKKVIVAGCLPEREGEQLFSQAEGIDAVVGLGQRDNIAGIIKKTLSRRHPAAYLNQSAQTILDDRTRLLITPGHWAYLRISEGCNHRCSFCTIPAIRGRFRSKPPELVLSEAGELVSSGTVELNIIAQDSTSYGRDLKIKNSLAALISELEKITGLSWIRLMYLYPTEIYDTLIDTITKSEKIVHYLDIPIQHVNNTILKAMRRPDSKDQLIRLIEKLRKAMPDIILRTTVIVGFPGETEHQFTELLDFIKWAKFDALGCFSFYPESGTAAEKMPNHVSEKIKQQRLEELMLTQQEIAFTKNKNRIGSQLTCLVDAVDSENEGRGRFYGQAPDIDSICIIKKCQARPGKFINTKVIGTKDYDLIVEQI
ncbi:MAG: 30S ribosomal protein S12 methylthiotransferase RimO [Planctomycetes bacterium]|nr:30S ribosomal protein S12 methylthiotransferase RimO [Planctomycetota bacterium]MBL7146281.1 30S ribosomal protein S12 methylthiotransferase RimO [Phycisphaerae bacterium]